jgi:hypothetical protein
MTFAPDGMANNLGAQAETIASAMYRDYPGVMEYI